VKKLLVHAVSVTVAIAFFCAADSKAAAPVALVYEGPGNCEGSCSDAAAEIPARMGMRIRFVNAKTIKKADFEDAVLWMQPGGNAIRAARALGPKGLKLIRDFVEGGGGYVGFCAGAFMTDTTTDYAGNVPGLGFVPGSQDYFKVQQDEKPVLVNVNWRGKMRKIYFNQGGYFDFQNSKQPLTVLGWFENNEGMPRVPASVFLNWGHGKVAVMGAHPEATAAWKRTDDLEDPDGSDQDIAEEMVRMVLPKGTLQNLTR
jgi:glutamine amidotransferase-like uncharacterized protein